jgi:Tfp pilus assembly protein PilV
MGTLGHRSRRLASEEGFALLEVMAAAVLLLVISMASLSVFDVSGTVSGRSKARSIAANLAQQDQDRMRTMKAFDLSNYHWARPVTVPGGGTYTLDSRAEWIRDAGGVESCTVSTTQANYLRVTSTVSIASLSQPVSMASLVAPPVASFDANRGTLTVQVKDRDGDPVPGADVSIGGPTSLSDTTNSLGCAVFSHIPVGTYTATTHKFGYVDNNGNDPGAVTGTPIVTAGKVAMVPARLDVSATINATFETYVNTYAAASNGGATGWVTSKADALTADPATASDPSILTPPGGWQGTLGVTNLFPFSEGYSLYTGSCASADPSAWISNYYASNAGTVKPADPGGIYTVKLRQAPLPAKVTTVLGTPQANAHIVATASGCAADKLDLTTDANGLVTHTTTPFDPGVPFGTYTVCSDVEILPSTSPKTYWRTSKTVAATAFTVSTPTTLPLPTLSLSRCS